MTSPEFTASPLARSQPGRKVDRRPRAGSVHLPSEPDLRVAVLIPCRDEESTIAEVVKGFSTALPNATVYVFDNGSRDASAERAAEAGAVVRTVAQPGKGNVVRRMFSDIDADAYILVDGDGTYDPAVAAQIVAKLREGIDLVNVARVPVGHGCFRRGHEIGNRALGRTLKSLFGLGLDDVLSGYKGCSRRLVKSFPVTSEGFEIETELVVHAVELNAAVEEFAAPYRPRPAGSASKLGTWSDGARILGALAGFVRHGRPMVFFGAIGSTLAVAGVALGAPVVLEFRRTHKVPRFPTAILATGLEVIAAQSIATGIAVGTVSRTRREQRMLAFLAAA